MIRVSSNDLEDLEKIGEGGFGVVYKIDDKTAYKIYKPTIVGYSGLEVENPSLTIPLSKYRQIINRGKKLKYTDLLSDFIYVDGKFGGVKIPYYDGIMLSKLREEKFELKKEITTQFIRNAEELDHHCIYPTDYKLANTMWVNGEVKIIDLDDDRTHYLRIPNRVYRSSSVRQLSDAVKLFFHESNFKPYSLAVANRLEKTRWVGLNQTFEDIHAFLRMRSEVHDFLVVTKKTNMTYLRELVNDHFFSVLVLYEENVLDDEIFLRMIRLLNQEGIPVHDFVFRRTFPNIYSDYNVGDVFEVSRKRLIKVKENKHLS